MTIPNDLKPEAQQSNTAIILKKFIESTSRIHLYAFDYFRDDVDVETLKLDMESNKHKNISTKEDTKAKETNSSIEPPYKGHTNDMYASIRGDGYKTLDEEQRVEPIVSNHKMGK